MMYHKGLLLIETRTHLQSGDPPTPSGEVAEITETAERCNPGRLSLHRGPRHLSDVDVPSIFSGNNPFMSGNSILGLAVTGYIVFYHPSLPDHNGERP